MSRQTLLAILRGGLQGNMIGGFVFGVFMLAMGEHLAGGCLLLASVIALLGYLDVRRRS